LYLCHSFQVASTQGSCPDSGGKQKWRILPVDEVHDQPAAWQAATGGTRHGKGISKSVGAHELEPASLSELIHQQVRVAIETAVHEELRAVLGTSPYERSEADEATATASGADAHGTDRPGGARVASGHPLQRCGRDRVDVDDRPALSTANAGSHEAVIATYLRAATPAGFAARSSRCSRPRRSQERGVARHRHAEGCLEAWRTRSLADLAVIFIYLDGFALRVRSAGKVVSVPALGVIGVLADGHKHLLALELCGGESFTAWKGCLDDLVARGLPAPVLAIIDGNAGLRRAVGLVWPRAAVQRCCVHKLRNLERKRRARAGGDPRRLPSDRLRDQC